MQTVRCGLLWCGGVGREPSVGADSLLRSAGRGRRLRRPECATARRMRARTHTLRAQHTLPCPRSVRPAAADALKSSPLQTRCEWDTRREGVIRSAANVKKQLSGSEDWGLELNKSVQIYTRGGLEMPCKKSTSTKICTNYCKMVIKFSQFFSPGFCGANLLY